MKSANYVLAAILSLLAVASCSPAPAPAPKATCATTSENLSLREVVGYGTDVFVAKVIARESSYDGMLGPVDIYRVEASNPLMGSANGPVRIGVPSVLIDGKPCRYGRLLPEVGQSYLFAANYDKSRQIFLTDAHEGDMTALTDADIAKIGTADEPTVVKDMREAVKSPIHPRI